MAYLMGIDLGTSSFKTMIIDEDGNLIALDSEGYSIEIPIVGFAEQDPRIWWKAAVNTIRKALNKSGISPEDIKCVGFSGQMHGMVLLDRDFEVIRPAIIHCDQRSKAQVDSIYGKIDKIEIGRITLNPIFTGSQIVSLLWVKEYEPENYQRTFKVILPKDYLRFKLTGEVATECTDASSTLAFETPKREWSQTLICQAGLDFDKYPICGEPSEISGYVTPEAALETGLREGTPVVFGGSDQPMQALGNGVIHEGVATSTIGTSGQIFTPIRKPVFNPELNTHSFCNILPGTWYAMGAILSAGLSLKWLKEKVIHGKDFKTIDDEATKIPACSEGIIFLPYLTGERTPHLNSDSRGMYFGLALKHSSAHLARATMEGVAFALRDSIEIFMTLGIGINKIVASGGGARSKLWLQIQADIFNREIYTTNTVEQACTGAAMIAGIGCGLYSNLQEASNIVVKVSDYPIIPNNESVKAYENYYHIFTELYKNNKELFSRL